MRNFAERGVFVISSTIRRLSIGKKLYIFISLTVLAVAFGTSTLAYMISAGQIDGYFKRLATNSAENFSNYVDVEYLAELRKAAESKEFQAVRKKAEKKEDETIVIDYLKEKGLWKKYQKTRRSIHTYLGSMDDIRYLYIVVLGEKNATHDMYLVDDFEAEVYQTGYYEEREEELKGIDPSKKVEPTINNGDWGWLCSAYEPVYDDDGNIVCHIGCDVDMGKIMSERYHFLLYILVSALIITALVLGAAIYFTNKVIIHPLVKLTAETKKFDPAGKTSYEDAGVVDLKLKNHDEINDIYITIRTMQKHIIDYLNDLSAMQRDNREYMNKLKRAEENINVKEEQLGQISREVYRDPLTGVGNKAGYVKKLDDLNEQITSGGTEFAIVMADLNDLKMINDRYGHKAGDVYIKTCCHIICKRYKHSPVFRVGGDEFVIILQGEDYINRYIIIEQVRLSLEHCFRDKSLPPEQRCSAALGMAEYDPSDSSAEQVFRRADKKMYENKLEFKKKYGSYR